LILIAVSWKSLRNPRSHGFSRFLAWECMLGLFLINVRFWFHEPFGWNQIIAWFLLIVCIVPLVFGVHALRKRGKPTRRRAGDSSLLAFEKTTELVTSGVYHYIRHPLYSSLLLLAWGIYFKHFSWLGTALVLAAAGFLILTAKADEKECVQFFGKPYAEYMQTTKMFIPFLF
jgi:protein-S-isoprenylcysteine O-methyltransferase Ste14